MNKNLVNTIVEKTRKLFLENYEREIKCASFADVNEEEKKILEEMKKKFYGNKNFEVSLDDVCAEINKKTGEHFVITITEEEKNNEFDFIHEYNVGIIEVETRKTIPVKKIQSQLPFHRFVNAHIGVNLVSDGILIFDEKTKDFFVRKEYQDAMWTLFEKNIEKQLNKTEEMFENKIVQAKNERKDEMKKIKTLSN